MDTRLIIFLVTGVCVGLPTLLWAVHFVYRQHQRSSPVSVFIISLLFSDFLELLLTPIVTETIHHPSSCWTASSVLLSVRIFGLLLHQLVALEAILQLHHPSRASRLSSTPCSLSITLSSLVWVLIIWPKSLSDTISHYNFPSVFERWLSFCGCAVQYVLSAIVTVAMFVLTCKVHASTTQPNRQVALMILFVFTVTTVVFYLPFLTLACIEIHTKYFSAGTLMEEPSSYTSYNSHGTQFMLNSLSTQPLIMSVSIMSLRLITDPLLCVLVCREVPRRQQLHAVE